MTVTMDDIREAAAVLDGEVIRTPTVHSPSLSVLTGAEVFLKLETLQRTGSFKDRGSLVKLKSLDAEQSSHGVIAISAGNHAQGVAYHAQRLGIPATIVMPEGTPFTKIRRTREFGAEVILHGDSVNTAEPFANGLAAERRLTIVHPYNVPKIIAGQGTIGLEILVDVPDLDTIIVPVGGGGIISGIAIAAKHLNPAVEIVGVEAELYPSMYNKLHGLEPPVGGASLADGISIKSPGALTLAIVRELAADLLIVSEAEIETAVQTMLTTGRSVAEGAGATPLAALCANPDRFAGKQVCLVVTGANIDARLLASALMRGLARAGHMARLRISLTDQTGNLAKVTGEIARAGGNIVEIFHQRMFYDVPLKLAEVDAVVETRDDSHAQEIISRLEAAGFPTRRLLDTNRQG
ncbi:MAG: threonine ammonia-lyase [Proteobacteria bacterium]|nr:threonine ammonia-lyase [Pseudomonadota bacterium]